MSILLQYLGYKHQKNYTWKQIMTPLLYVDFQFKLCLRGSLCSPPTCDPPTSPSWVSGWQVSNTMTWLLLLWVETLRISWIKIVRMQCTGMGKHFRQLFSEFLAGNVLSVPPESRQPVSQSVEGFHKGRCEFSEHCCCSQNSPIPSNRVTVTIK